MSVTVDADEIGEGESVKINAFPKINGTNITDSSYELVYYYQREGESDFTEFKRENIGSGVCSLSRSGGGSEGECLLVDYDTLFGGSGRSADLLPVYVIIREELRNAFGKLLSYAENKVVNKPPEIEIKKDDVDSDPNFLSGRSLEIQFLIIKGSAANLSFEVESLGLNNSKMKTPDATIEHLQGSSQLKIIIPENTGSSTSDGYRSNSRFNI